MAVRPSDASQTPVLVPKLVTDPLASLRAVDLRVALADMELSVPAMSAVEWLEVLMDDDFTPDMVFPDLCDDPEAVEDALLAGDANMDDVVRVALDCVSMASGRPWWVTVRLVATAKGSWDAIGGEMVLKGLDASRLTLGAWLDALMIVMVRAIGDNAKANQFLMKLEAPPPGEEVVIEPMDADQFMSMM